MSLRLESNISAPKNLVLGGFTPSVGSHRSDPQNTSLHGTTRFELLRVQIRRSVQSVWAWQRKQKKNKKKKKKTMTVANHWDHPRRCSPYRIKVCMPGGFQCVVLYIKLYQKIGSVFFYYCGWSNIACFHYFGHWLIQRLLQAVIVVIIFCRVGLHSAYTLMW